MWKPILWMSFFLVFIGCSPKLRYPVEESKRPLSLPPKNWGLSLGLGAAWTNYSSESLPIAKTNIPPGYLPVFAFPHVPLFEGQLELHFSLLKLKYYPLRNVEIVDSALCITGPNLAVGGGASAQTVDFFIASFDAPFPWEVFIQFKTPLKQKTWMSAGANFTRRSHRVFHSTSVHLESGLGYQFTPEFHGTIDVSCTYYKEIRPKVTHIWHIPAGHTETRVEEAEYEEFGAELPLQLGYNFNKHWKLFVTGLAGYGFVHAALYAGGGAGFDVYW